MGHISVSHSKIAIWFSFFTWKDPQKKKKNIVLANPEPCISFYKCVHLVMLFVSSLSLPKNENKLVSLYERKHRGSNCFASLIKSTDQTLLLWLPHSRLLKKRDWDKLTELKYNRCLCKTWC